MEFGPAVCALVEPRVGWLEKKEKGALVPLAVPNYRVTWPRSDSEPESVKFALAALDVFADATMRTDISGLKDAALRLDIWPTVMHECYRMSGGSVYKAGLAGFAATPSPTRQAPDTFLVYPKGCEQFRLVALHGVRGHRMPSLLRSTAPKILA